MALASSGFQTLTVHEVDAPTGVPDQTRCLQGASCFGHGLAAYAQHGRDRFLGHGQLLVVEPVKHQQQPAAQMLVQRVLTVAHRRLRDLGQLGLHEQQQLAHDRPGVGRFSFEQISG